jgi:hypothetical protein
MENDLINSCQSQRVKLSTGKYKNAGANANKGYFIVTSPNFPLYPAPISVISED